MGIANLSQHIPAAVGSWRTAAVALVQIGAAGWTEPLAVISALEERGNGEEPLFPDRRSHVEFVCVGVDAVDVLFVRLLVAGVGE